MASSGVGKFLISLALLFIVMGILSVYDIGYGTPAQAQSFNNTNIQTYSNYTNKVYNPLEATVANSTGSSNNLPAASAASGFAYAFVIQDFGNIYSQMVQTPNLLAGYIGTLFQGLDIPGINTSSYTNTIKGLMLAFLGILAVSLWSKYPFW